MAAGSTYTPIQTYTGTGSSGVITFSSIPSTYTDLVLVSQARNSTATYQVERITFNNDTGSNYSYTRLGTDGSSSPFSDRSSNATFLDSAYTWGTNASSGIYTQLNMQIQNYANTSTYKTALMRQSGVYTMATVGLWRSTAAINRIDITAASGNWDSNSTFTLYGILAA